MSGLKCFLLNCEESEYTLGISEENIRVQPGKGDLDL